MRSSARRSRGCRQNAGKSKSTSPSTWMGLSSLGTVLVSAGVPGALALNTAGAQADAPAKLVPVANRDEIGPAVTILRPGYADALRDEAQIVIAVESRRYTPSVVEMFVDGRSATNGGAIKLEAQPSATFRWPTRQYADGPHKLTVRVTDTQGFRGEASVIVYINNQKKIDQLPPKLEWLGIESGKILQGEQKIQLNAVDNFGVKWLFVSLNPIGTPNHKPALRSWMLSQPPYEIALDTRKINDGVYILNALALDSLENEGLGRPLFVGVANNGINPTWNQELDALVRGQQTAPVGAIPGVPVNTNPPVQPNPAPSTPIGIGTQLVEAPGLPKLPGDPKNTQVARIEPPRPTRPQLSVSSVPPATTVAPHKTDGVREGEMAAPGKSGAGQATLLASLPELSKRASVQEVRPTRANSSVSPMVNSIISPGKTRKVSPGSKIAARIGLPLVNKVSSNAPLIAKAQLPPASIRDLSRPRFSMPSSKLPRFSTVPPQVQTAPVPVFPNVAVDAAAVPVAATAPLSGLSLTPKRTAVDGLITAPGMGSGIAQPIGAPRPSRPELAMLPSKNPSETMPVAGAITVSPLFSAKTPVLPALHVAQRDETLRSIADRYRMPVAVLAAANGMTTWARVPSGTPLHLPQAVLVTYKGKPVTGDVASLMVGSTSVTPFRFLFKKQGGALVWDAKHHQVLARNATHEVTLTIGSRTAKVNRKEVMMDLAAFLLSGRTMVPVRFFEKALHAQVEWEPSSGRLYVAMSG